MPPANPREPARLPFLLSLALLAMLYGMWAWERGVFPANLVASALATLQELSSDEREQLLTVDTAKPPASPPAAHSYSGGGLTLITGKGKLLRAAVIDAAGEPVQEWMIDWHTLWPEADHLTAEEIPRKQPGTHVHGAVLMPDGDLVFNFEHLGMMRLDPCNRVVWRLPYRTHHSIHIDAEGMLWASGQRNHDQDSSTVPGYRAPFIEPTLVRVSPDGELLLEKSVLELLQQNDLHGLLYLQGTSSFSTATSGDTLHLNDVEPFDPALAPGEFAPGDVMISLRNVNAVLVFDALWRLKHSWIGEFVRQHDPDFIDGNRVSLYDNHFVGAAEGERASRILVRDFSAGETTTVFSGDGEPSFYSFIMGKHQWLDNGNLLLAETTGARAIEVTPAGELAWEFHYRDSEGKPDLLEQAERLPAMFTPAFFAEARAACDATTAN